MTPEATFTYAPSMTAHAYYLQDLGHFIREYGLQAKKDAESADEFDKGRAMAYYEVLSLMQQQADAFGLPLAELGLGDFDADRDML